MAERASLVVVAAVLAGLLLVAVGTTRPASAAASVPNGFADEAVVDVPSPIALAFAPDGLLLVTTKPGELMAYREGDPVPEKVLDLSSRVCDDAERGLLGVAVDPQFETNGFVYLYYTYKKHDACPYKQPASKRNPVNRVSRFMMTGGEVDPRSELVLLDNMPSPNGNHNGGDLHFGADGYLYASIGDGGCDYAQPTRCQAENDAARDRNVLLGKVMRITRDGGIPPDNPFTGPGSGRCGENGRTARGKDCQETFATGFRNPFRMAFDPDRPGTFHVNDVGWTHREEVNVGRSGGDYGWNCREAHRVINRTGKCDPRPRGLVFPVHHYSHATGCSSITGGAFVPDGAWPGYDDAYLYGDFVCGRISSLTPKAGGGYAEEVFARDLGRGGVVSMAFGPDGGGGEALYYTTFAGDNGGQVRRVVRTSG